MESTRISLTSSATANGIAGQVLESWKNGGGVLPPLDSLRPSALRVGHLKRLCGRGLWSAGTWKDRIALLQGHHLILYEKQNEKDVGSGGIILNLGEMDKVSEAPTRVTRKAANVFSLGSSDKSFFESRTHYFACKTMEEMRDWVSLLKSTIHRYRSNSLVLLSRPTESISSNVMKSNEKSNKVENIKMVGDSENSSTGSTPFSGTEIQLDCNISKRRTRGPPGRRLPRSKKSIDALLLELDGADGFGDDMSSPPLPGRTTSLSALETTECGEGISLRPMGRSTSNFSSVLSSSPTNPHVRSVDFEKAWFLKLPKIGLRPRLSSDYFSLHEDEFLSLETEESPVPSSPKSKSSPGFLRKKVESTIPEESRERLRKESGFTFRNSRPCSSIGGNNSNSSHSSSGRCLIL